MLFANIMGGPYDILIIAGVVVLLFGGAKLPGLMKSLGEGMKEFKKATHEMTGDSSEPKLPAQSAVAPVAGEASTPPAVDAPTK